MNKVLLLDRDGTLVRAMPRGEHLLRLDQLEIVPGAVQLLERAKELDYKLAVATNQPQIGKGLLSPVTLAEIHFSMEKQLGGMLDKVYACPHINEDNCDCRKPKPGMLLQALKEFGVDDPNTSFMIGDSDRDVLAGQAAGLKTIFVLNEYNESELSLCRPLHVVRSLEEILSLNLI